jgi:methylmalonyl-CoA mutase N-terminal domain/subunit
MDAAYAYQKALDSKDKIVVGVNEFVEQEEDDRVEILYIDEAVEEQQKKDLAALRRSRDGTAVSSALGALRQACADGKNVMPPLIEAVKTYATVGEISDVMREVFATYEEPAVF